MHCKAILIFCMMIYWKGQQHSKDEGGKLLITPTVKQQSHRLSLKLTVTKSNVPFVRES